MHFYEKGSSRIAFFLSTDTLVPSRGRAVEETDLEDKFNQIMVEISFDSAENECIHFSLGRF